MKMQVFLSGTKGAQQSICGVVGKFRPGEGRRAAEPGKQNIAELSFPRLRIVFQKLFRCPHVVIRGFDAKIQKRQKFRLFDFPVRRTFGMSEYHTADFSGSAETADALQ